MVASDRLTAGWGLVAHAAGRLRARSTAVVGSVLALTLAVSASAVVVTDSQDAVLAALGVDASEPGECPLEVATLREAHEVAARCDQDVEATDERTPWQQFFATPHAQVRLESTTEAQRSDTDGDGTWTDISTALVEDEAGRVEVEAPAMAMSFSAGGSKEPLAIATTPEGQKVEVPAPFDLPAPQIEGDALTYPGVLPGGIDLVVEVAEDGSGWRQALRIPDAKAAQSPDLARLGDALGLDVKVPTGLDVAREWGSVTVSDGESEPLRSSRPVVWTSLGDDAQVGERAERSGRSDATTTGSGGKSSAAAISAATSDGQQLAPSSQAAVVEAENGEEPAEILGALAEKQDTQYPVFAAQAVGGQVNEVTAVRSAWPTSSSSYQFSGDAGAGLCDASDRYGAECGRTSRHRILYEFGGLSKIAGLSSSEVTKATMDVYGTFSYDCTKRPTAVYLSGSNVVSSSTNWNRKGSWGTRLDTTSVTHRPGCSGKRNWTGFSILGGAKKVASSNWSRLTLGIKTDESSMKGWNRYVGRSWNGDRAASARISITYNQKPYKPSGLQTVQGTDSKGCKTGASRPVLSTTRPKVSAIVKDPDGNPGKAHFQVWKVSNNSSVWSAYSGQLSSGRRHTLRVPDGKLNGNNTVYKWRVRAKDSAGNLSSWQGWCEFKVDTAKPNTPTVEPVTTGVEAVYVNDGVEAGGIGFTGKFTFGRNGSGDVQYFKYGFNDAGRPHTASVGSNGTATVSFTPKEPGPVTLTVRSRDKAGNFSTVRSYTFDVAAPIATAVWPLDDGSGESATEIVRGAGSQSLAFRGPEGGGLPTWTDGPHELFRSRNGDGAVLLDGVDDRIVAANPVVDTTSSFVVSAHVRLDILEESAVALSQNASEVSGFKLGYRADCVGGGCWDFWMPESNTTSPVAAHANHDAPGPDEPVPVAGEWVHLTGAYDADADTVSLWVCSIGTSDDPTAAEPVAYSGPHANPTPWEAQGAFVAGYSVYRGERRDRWTGAVDNIRVFDGQVVAENKIRRLCQGADGRDFLGGLGALDPTVSDATVEDGVGQ